MSGRSLNQPNTTAAAGECLVVSHSLVPTTKRKAKHTKTAAHIPQSQLGGAGYGPGRRHSWGLAWQERDWGMPWPHQHPKGEQNPRSCHLHSARSSPHSTAPCWISGGLCQTPKSLQEAQVNTCIWDDFPPLFSNFPFLLFFFPKKHICGCLFFSLFPAGKL